MCVCGLKEAPAGKFDAEKVRLSPFGSVAETLKLIELPTVTVLLPMELSTGGRFGNWKGVPGNTASDLVEPGG